MDLPELVTDDVLEADDVVANSTMNRERGLTGANSYAKELAFDPLGAVLERRGVAAPDSEVTWVDVCCGTGRALADAALELDRRGLSGVRLVGLDLVDRFDPRTVALPAVELRCAAIADWRPDVQVDVITSVHGLHYVGDKLAALTRLAAWLDEDGTFVANLDPASIRVAGRTGSRTIIASLRSAGFEVDTRRRLVRRRGGGRVELPYRYLGADRHAGPNYTGQPAVDSYYERVR